MKTHEVDRLALLIHIIANTLTGQSFMVVQIIRNHNQLDASLAHAVFEHGLLRSGFCAGVDDGATVGEGVAPAHGKGLDILLPAVRQHRDNIGGENLAGGFQPFRRLFAVQFVNHPAEFIGQVILGDVVATTHGQFPLSDGCTV